MSQNDMGSQGQRPQRLPSSPLLNKIVPQDDVDELYAMYPDLPKNHLRGCPSCGKNQGDGRDGLLVLNGVPWVCNCHDQLQRHKHYLNAGIGATYQFLSWDDFGGDNIAVGWVKKWVAEMDLSIESGTGLYIWGSENGTGKTTLGSLALKECVMSGYTCYMTTFQNMLSSMKSGWKDAHYEKWYKRKIDSAQVLLIDDVGKEIIDNTQFNKDFAKQTLDSLLRTRTQQCRPTLFTSNLSPAGIGQYYGQAVVSLLNENVVAVAVNGVDYRREVTQKVKGKRRIY